MKGRKGSTDEGGVRSPCIISWPGKIPAGHTVTCNGAALDLHPTLASLAGISTVNKQPLDGIDLSAAIRGINPDTDDRIIVSHWKNKVSAKSGACRLGNKGQLFDLRSDPGQRENVVAKHPEVTARLRNAVTAFRKDLLPGYDDDQRPFVIAHQDATVTQLPARDAKVSGGLKRSNKFPNASFFTNWTSTEGEIAWDVEVATAGEFEAEVYYSCPSGSEGSTLMLSFGDANCVGKLTKAKPPEIIGAEQDHFVRAESYTQNWARMTLGTIRLQPGSGTLTLKATEMPGESVMDFRLLLLKRK